MNGVVELLVGFLVAIGIAVALLSIIATFTWWATRIAEWMRHERR